MSDELHIHVEPRMNPSDPFGRGDGSGDDEVLELEPSDTYEDRFSEMLSLFGPQEECAAEFTHN